MPIYDYKCKDCGNQFELLVLKATVPACPSCESQSLEQLLSTGIAVSTTEVSRARVKKAREKYIASKDYKDKRIAEAEDIKEHHDH